MTQNHRNQFDKRDSLEQGERAEKSFTQTATSRGWEVSASPELENIERHWDYLICKGDERFKVEVKSLKREGRGDKDFSCHWVWLEFHSVRQNNRGWLYQGEADLIAFEKTSSFVLVNRLELISLAEKLVDMNSRVRSSREAKYKLYQRPGRFDLISQIEMSKIEEIKWDEWKKLIKESR